jgi:hypothetical protein
VKVEHKIVQDAQGQPVLELTAQRPLTDQQIQAVNKSQVAKVVQTPFKPEPSPPEVMRD